MKAPEGLIKCSIALLSDARPDLWAGGIVIGLEAFNDFRDYIRGFTGVNHGPETPEVGEDD